ncbi:hypothetical protein PoB_003148400 [Plakobranchus ocellatus]|uniref:Uncharacterized protein n=1 Tax=Plakobranchus ocellatus TaxID=259542 RepID=A0AAV4AFD7_9GAST|nr:hypothetical protein PoB_003148400 [Plakobranchus ocellatus]
MLLNASEPVYSEVSQEASPEAWETLEQIDDPRDTSKSQVTEEWLDRRNFTAGTSVARPNPRPRKRKQPGQEENYWRNKWCVFYTRNKLKRSKRATTLISCFF